ncbi:MAG: hypothetical protein GF398_17920 [Chitinivibrionales bacterium]|nr:hypothetical protein [Chitinivibrionales bacterium]
MPSAVSALPISAVMCGQSILKIMPWSTVSRSVMVLIRPLTPTGPMLRFVQKSATTMPWQLFAPMCRSILRIIKSSILSSGKTAAADGSVGRAANGSGWRLTAETVPITRNCGGSMCRPWRAAKCWCGKRAGQLHVSPVTASWRMGMLSTRALRLIFHRISATQKQILFCVASWAGVKAAPSCRACNQANSPTGSYWVSTHSAGHHILNVTRVVDYQNRITEGAATVEIGDWNDGALDSAFQYCVPYSGDTCYRIEKTGGGLYTISNWTVNSDYWWNPISGWSPGGRFGDNGTNLVIINWRDSTSLNITRNPHKTAVNWNLDNNDSTMADGREAGDGQFWVSAPLSDVVPEFQDDVTNRDSYSIPCIDDNAACAQAETKTNLQVTKNPTIECADSIFTDNVKVFLGCEETGAVVRYTTDGSWPQATSPAFTDSITIDTTLLLRAVAFKDGQAPSWWPIDKKFKKLELVIAQNVQGDAAGLNYYWYKGDYSILPETFDGLAPTDSGTLDAFTAEPFGGQNYLVQIWGYIDVPQTGIYTFNIKADDGARLYIGSEAVVEQPVYQNSFTSGRVMLEAGKHPILVTFLQIRGGRGLDVTYAGPGVDSANVPASALTSIPSSEPQIVRAGDGMRKVVHVGPLSIRVRGGITTCRIWASGPWLARASGRWGRTNSLAKQWYRVAPNSI